MNPSPLMTQSDKDIGWIETYSGKQFYLDGTDTDSIVIEDIAHALANLCRYNGHTNRFYSVAEHSVLVSYAVPKEYALWGLMHDASEAYLSDIPRPFKAMIANYKTMEEHRPQHASWSQQSLLHSEETVSQSDLPPHRCVD